jgi:N-acetyl-gamma-glutamyl-phosphate reductase
MATVTTYTAGIAGASGYAGLELQRLLRAHPSLSATVLQARSDPYDDIDAGALAGCDVVFLCLPHGASREIGTGLAAAGSRVVDLGSDFRVGGWLYGLPELHRDALHGARLVANPGCYATAVLLALAPVSDEIDPTGVVVDAMSGMTGAGRSLRPSSHAGAVLENVAPYRVGAHQHAPEIAAQLGFPVTFVPHLLPVRRGLIATCVVRSRGADLRERLEDHYSESHVVDVLPAGVAPELARVQQTDGAEIGVFEDALTGATIVICALDNLGKGAAGQAIQNVNVLYGLDETTGLRLSGVLV